MANITDDSIISWINLDQNNFSIREFFLLDFDKDFWIKALQKNQKEI
jgi:hypothetical protein